MTKEELKQEAEEYISSNCKRWEFDGLTVDDIVSEVYLAGAEPRENQIAELEKENAELKPFKQDCIRLTEDNVVMARQRAETARQLTKAKEIIKKLYSHVFQGIGFMELNDYNVQKAEAEQFLKEVEK